MLMTLDEVAVQLGVRPGYVRTMLRRGDLPHIKLSPRKTRIPADAVAKIVASATSPEPAA